MVIDIFDHISFLEKLEILIRKEYKPENTSEGELVANLCDCYENDMCEAGTSYFSVENDPLADIVSYAKFCGGYKAFDFVV